LMFGSCTVDEVQSIEHWQLSDKASLILSYAANSDGSSYHAAVL
jgi:hypothetical protein